MNARADHECSASRNKGGAGKGDAPHHNLAKFRLGYEGIDWHPKPREPEVQPEETHP